MELDLIIKHGVGRFSGMSGDLAAMERILEEACGSAGELSGGLRRINSSGGKRLRPMLAWICRHMSGEREPIVPLMCMLELMHTASLIHDDIVDGAHIRRGAVTINKQDGIKAAIRSGDYLLAEAMGFLKIYRGTGINEALSRVSELMSLGELRRQERLFETEGLCKEEYTDYIYGKTAALIAESCRCGATAGGASEDESLAILEFGRHLGMAFQMRDDCLDWTICAETGKAPLQDLRSGVMTLPVILALENDINNEELRELLIKRDKNEEEIQRVFQLVRSAGALETAQEYVRREYAPALEALTGSPDGPEKDALIQLAKSISEVK
ncbi:MAG: polyprenyl synthetase family protein [Oscillospiraceae bacterium]|nr:polyprenyl synthetase family protein [Oscillospiraceae bacterium]